MRNSMPPVDNPSQFGEWLRAARNGSVAALGQILQCCQPYLVKVAAAELDADLLNRVGSEDVVQDTFAEAVKDIRGFRGTTEHEACVWLRQILLNNISDVRRALHTEKRQAVREVSPSDFPPNHRANNPLDPGSTPSKKVRNQERSEAIERAKKQLPEHYQEAIRLYFYEKCSYEEIGRRLGVTADAARKLRLRAVWQIAKLMKSYGRPE